MDDEELKESLIKAKIMLLNMVNKKMNWAADKLKKCIEGEWTCKELTENLSDVFKDIEEIKCELKRIEEL